MSGTLRWPALEVVTPRVALQRLGRAMPAGVRDILGVMAAKRCFAVVVGGAVRDVFLGRRVADWDIASAAPPAAIMGWFGRVAAVGVRHGTVVVVTASGPVEVTSLRAPSGWEQRHGDWAGLLRYDLGRRDFTMNAMAADVQAGWLDDPWGGAADLAGGVVRCVGAAAERLHEDPLRGWRALRLAAVLGCRLHAGTRAAIGRMAPEALAGVAWERKRDELLRLLAGGREVAWALRVARRTGLLAALSGELAATSARTGRLVESVGVGQPWLRLTLWLAAQGVEEEAATALLRRWRVGRRESTLVVAALRAWGEVAAGLARGGAAGGAVLQGARLRRWVAHHGRSAAVLAAQVAQRLGGAACGDFVARAVRVARRRRGLGVEELAVGGDDLLALGLRGRAVGEALESLLGWVLEQPQFNRRDCLLKRLRGGGRV